MTRDTAIELLGYVGIAAAVIAILAAVFVVPPVLLIWCLNTLFPALAIPTNSYTVLAGLALIMLVRPLRYKGGEA